MKDKGTILNEVVAHAADIMRMKLTETKCIVEQLQSKPEFDERRQVIISRLHTFMSATASAIETMDENGGCWS